MDNYIISADGSGGFKIEIRYGVGGGAGSGPNFETEADARKWIEEHARSAEYTISMADSG